MTHCWCRDGEKLCLFYTIWHQYIRIASNIYQVRASLAKCSDSAYATAQFPFPISPVFY